MMRTEPNPSGSSGETPTRGLLTRLVHAAALVAVGLFLLIGLVPSAEANSDDTTTECGLTPGDCCDRQVQGRVVFRGDVQCMDQSGLIVVASNTTIDFRGFRLQCADPLDPASFHQSCQGGAIGDATPDVGVTIGPGLSNVHVRGAGSIVGFDQGVLIDGGWYSSAAGHKIEKVHVSGPDAMGGLFNPTFVNQERPLTQGIVVQNVKCQDSSVNIRGNSVDNHTLGILLSDASCIDVQSNFAHDANSGSVEFAGEASIGIAIRGSGNADWDGTRKASRDNTVHNNLVIDSGINVAGDAGIALEGNVTYNVVANNLVSYNNGDGIVTRAGARGNRISNNTLNLNTSTEPTTPSCTDGGTSITTVCSPTENMRIFYDLAEETAGANQFDANNRCETESAGVPSTVCNAGETRDPLKK